MYNVRVYVCTLCGAYVSCHHCVVTCGEYVTSSLHTRHRKNARPQSRLQTGRCITVEVRFLRLRNEAIVMASEVAVNSYSAIS
jgi:hypothetical protein